jgi:Spy/CpxP family protein refolding chaperone
MSDAKVAAVKESKPKTIDDEISAQREKLKKLEERKRDQERKEKEKNTKAVAELIKTEKLDSVSSEMWKAAMPAIKAALKMEKE